MPLLGEGWNSRFDFTLPASKVPENTENVPVKVIVPGSDISLDKMQPDGKDIRFALADNTLLPFEREVHQMPSLYFDGVDDYATVDISSIPEGSFTWEIRYVHKGIASANAKIASVFPASDPQRYFILGMKSSSGKYYIAHTGDSAEGSFDPVVGTEYLLSFTYDSATKQANLYVDGSLDIATTFSSNAIESDIFNEPLMFGNQGNFDNPCEMTLKEFRWWSEVRDQIYIIQDQDTTFTGNEDNLKIYFRFTEGSGLVLNNLVQEDNDGTIYGATWNESILVYHTLLPSVSSTEDTLFYMYYDNPDAVDGENKTEVWSHDYELVMHMDGSLEDSTSNNNNGTNNGSTLGLASDGYYRSFDGSNLIEIGRDVSLEPISAITFEVYCSMSTASQNDYAKPLYYGQNSAPPYGAYGFETNNGYSTQLRVAMTVNSSRKEIGSVDLTGLGKHLTTGRYDENSISMFDNGTLNDSISVSGDIGDYGTYGLGIGDKVETGQGWKGNIYEVRISSIARSDAYIAITSESLHNTLLVTGTEESGNFGEEPEYESELILPEDISNCIVIGGGSTYVAPYNGIIYCKWDSMKARVGLLEYKSENPSIVTIKASDFPLALNFADGLTSDGNPENIPVHLENDIAVDFSEYENCCLMLCVDLVEVEVPIEDSTSESSESSLVEIILDLQIPIKVLNNVQEANILGRSSMIPNMTSSTENGFEIIATNETTGHEGYKAFNELETAFWQVDPAGPAELIIKLPTERAVDLLAVRGEGYIIDKIEATRDPSLPYIGEAYQELDFTWVPLPIDSFTFDESSGSESMSESESESGYTDSESDLLDFIDNLEAYAIKDCLIPYGWFKITFSQVDKISNIYLYSAPMMLYDNLSNIVVDSEGIQKYSVPLGGIKVGVGGAIEKVIPYYQEVIFTAPSGVYKSF